MILVNVEKLRKFEIKEQPVNTFTDSAYDFMYDDIIELYPFAEYFHVEVEREDGTIQVEIHSRKSRFKYMWSKRMPYA